MEKARLIDIPRIYDPRGNLSFLEESDNRLPFALKRVYWTYDVPGGEHRGEHSHILGHELIVAVSGSFNVNLFDGKTWQTFTMNRPFIGLYVPPQYWRTLDNFSSGSVMLVLSSEKFSEADYIRDFNTYLATIKDND